MGDSAVCGYSANLAVTFFRLAGYLARRVEHGPSLNGHIAAEINYDGKWHYFDASLFSGGNVATLDGGLIPSLEYISRNEAVIDSVEMFSRPSSNRPVIVSGKSNPGTCAYNVINSPDYEPSRRSKIQRIFAHALPKYIEALIQPDATHCYDNYPVDGESGPQGPSVYASWYYRNEASYTTCHDFSHEALMIRSPAAPRLISARFDQQSGILQLSWHRPEGAEDPACDLCGFRVFISGKSRGWHYDKDLDQLPHNLKLNGISARKASQGATPENLYQSRHKLPVNGKGSENSVEQWRDFSRDDTNASFQYPYDHAYITLMSLGKRGVAAGKKFFPMSEEILITRD